ncbi:MAG: ACT domain-containing protein [Nitrospirae bacterium]|nr:ACT domain-containing protein [Nitrospirota bacterium]
MAKATKMKQLSLEMPDKPGQLAEVATTLAGVKVNISAICAYGMEGKAYFMLITDSNAKAKKALAKLGCEIKEEDVFAVEMPDKVGEMQKTARKIADAGINVNYIYGTISSGKTSVCVFSTDDDKKALRVINK